MGGYVPGTEVVAASAINVPAGGTPTDLCVIDLSNLAGIQLNIEWTYGTGATEAGLVLLLRRTSATPTWQGINDNPLELKVPTGDGVPRNKPFALDALRWPFVKLQAVNNEATLAATVTVRYVPITYSAA